MDDITKTLFRGLEFTIGREYQIFIRNHESQTIKIRFKSFYGYRRAELHKLNAHILKQLRNPKLKHVKRERYKIQLF
jgi:hypothetical protein